MLRIDEALAGQEDESAVGIRLAPDEGGKRARCAVHTTTCCIAVDEQDDIAPGDQSIGQPLLCRVMHPGTAVQADDGGKRSGAIGPGQIALDGVARHDRARNASTRGAFKLNALQSRGPCISHQPICDAPKHQHCRGQGDCSLQWRLPRMFVRCRRTPPRWNRRIYPGTTRRAQEPAASAGRFE